MPETSPQVPDPPPPSPAVPFEEFLNNPLYRNLIVPRVKMATIINPANNKELILPFEAAHVVIQNVSTNVVYLAIGGSGGASPNAASAVCLGDSFVSIPVQNVTTFSVSIVGADTTTAPQVILTFYDHPFAPAMGKLN